MKRECDGASRVTMMVYGIGGENSPDFLRWGHNESISALTDHGGICSQMIVVPVAAAMVC